MLVIVLLSMQLLQARGQEWDIKLHSLYPSLPIADPWSDNEECRNDSRLLIQALNNFSLWAVQMLDASSRQSDGILYGNLYQMGNYDECMEITKPILAQYCLVKVSAKISTNSSFNFDPFVQNYDPHLSAWHKMSVETLSRMPRNSIYQALCVPASCSHQDLETAVNQYLKKHRNPIGIQYTAEVAPNLCSVTKEEPYTLGEQMFMSVIAFISLLVATGTILDYAYGGTPQSGMLILDLLLCFSMRKNLKSLKPPHESTKLDVLNSFKFICICFIIFCHRAGWYGASPLWNLEFVEREFELSRSAFMHRGDLIVDNFFVIGGLLMSYMLLKELPKGRVKAIQLILLRMLRLIPALSMMVFFYATVFYRLDSGPRWDAVIGPEREYCQKNWWTNLLFINNYVDVEHLCLMQSYYIACDMHFFIIAIPVVMLLWRRPLLGVLTLIVLTVLSILVPFFITYLNQMPAIIVLCFDVMLSPRTNDVFSSVYVKSHARAGPYLIGLATGYLMHKFENNKPKLGMRESIILCLGIVNMLGAIMMYGTLFYDVSRPYSAIEAGLFAALQRFFWALGTSAFIIIIIFGTVPMVSSILSNKLLIRLGHLVYGLVLVHPVVLYYDLGSLRHPEYVQYHIMFISAIGDIVISLIMALALFLTVEEPFRQMTKLILSRLVIVLLSMQLLQARGQEWDIKLPSLYPSLPIADPWSDNEECRNDSRLLIQALNNFSLWAVQMLDASSRQSDGILYGNLYQMGNYDECMEITKPILAQYCLVKVSAKISTNSSFNFDPFVQNYDPHLSAWHKMSVETLSRMPRNSIYQALCVPASCSHQDLETAVNQYLKKHRNPIGIQYTAEVAPNLCSVTKEEPYTLGEQIFMSVIAFISLLVATGTILDYAYGGTPQSGMLILDLLLCFSMRKNLKSLKPPHESTKLDVLNSFKFICICFIIFCHRAGWYAVAPLWNLEFVEREFELSRSAFMHRGDLIVDNFFVIAGLLMSYMLLKELPKGRVKAIQLILLRMLRLIPALSMMVFFYATVFYRLDSGPRWDAVIGPEREYCQKNWWTNLLFINNYVDVEHLCLMQSYYIACDMHFFIIAIPVVMLLWRRPLLGVLTLIVLTVLSILVPFFITYLNQMPAIIVVCFDLLLSPRTNDVFSSVYVKSHARAGPYLIGLATGYLMHKFENNKPKLGMRESIILCLGIVNMLGATMMYGTLFNDVSRPYSAIEAGLFAALQRFFWGLGTSAFIIIIIFGTVPMVSSILSNKLLIGLGHLVYGLVLVHPVVLYYDLGSLRRPEYVQYHILFISAIGDIVISLIMALALFLTVEEPFRQMTKLILSSILFYKVVEWSTVLVFTAGNTFNKGSLQHQEI